MLTCSAACLDEPTTGTASAARFFLALEQRGPWGKKAFTQSRLDPDLGAQIEHAAKDAGGKALLVRAPGEKAHTGEDGPRTVFLAWCDPAAPWLLRGSVAEAADVLDLPLDRLGPTPPTIDGFSPVEPVALVCTNAKRDQCCARLGLGVAQEGAAAHPGRVWECSHTGGHRYAPTGVVLPTGQLLGRMSADVVADALAAAGRGEVLVDAAHDRGRAWVGDPVLEAAETWLRAQTGVAALADVVCSRDGETGVLASVAGRTHRLTMRALALPAMPASCGAEPKSRQPWVVASHDAA